MMASVRLSGAVEIIHGEFPPPCLSPRISALLEQIERDRLVPHPWAIRRPEIWYAAFSRNPCTREADNDPRPLNHFLECGD